MNALRMVFLSIAGVVLSGIWLTGFDHAHWVLYVPVVLLGFAGITGICPGLIFWNKAGSGKSDIAAGSISAPLANSLAGVTSGAGRAISSVSFCR